MKNNPMRKNRKFYIGMILTVIEGLLSGCNFFLLYGVMKMLWNGDADLPPLLRLTAFLGVIFALRIVIYGAGYTDSQIVPTKIISMTQKAMFLTRSPIVWVRIFS